MASATIARAAGATATIARAAGATATIARQAGATATIAWVAPPDPVTPLVTTGLVADYKFDQGSGQQLTDYTANAYHGTLGSTAGADTNDPAWSSLGLTFAIDDYVRIPAGALGGTGAATVMAVVRLSGDGNYPHVLGGNPGDSGIRLLFNAAARQPWARVKNAAAQSTDAVSTTVIALNTWVCLTARFRPGAGLDIWINGAQDTTAATTIVDRVAPTEGLIGTDGPAAGQTLPGDVAMMVLYNRALSDAELTQNYQALKDRLTPRGVVLP